MTAMQAAMVSRDLKEIRAKAMEEFCDVISDWMLEGYDPADVERLVISVEQFCLTDPPHPEEVQRELSWVVAGKTGLCSNSCGG